MSTHVTDLEQFVVCPGKYWFRKSKTLPDFTPWYRERGTIIHVALCEGWSKGDLDFQIKDEMTKQRDVPLAFAPEDTLKETNEMWDQIQGVRDYIDQNDIEVTGQEETFYFDFAGTRFESTVDLIAKHPDSPTGMVEAWDFKTGVKWGTDSLNRKLQFGVYYCACGSKGIKVNRFFWAHTKDLLRYKKDGKWGKKGDFKGPFLYPVYITQDDIPLITDWVQRILKAIDNGINYFNPQAPCNMCEYAKTCPKYDLGVSTGERRIYQLESADQQQDNLEQALLDKIKESESNGK